MNKKFSFLLAFFMAGRGEVYGNIPQKDLFHSSTVLLQPTAQSSRQSIGMRTFVTQAFTQKLPPQGVVSIASDIIKKWHFSRNFSDLGNITDIFLYGQGGNHKVRRFGGGVLDGCWALQNNHLPGPTLLFDLPTAFFASMRESRVKRLDEQYQAVLSYNPTINIIFSGVCIGATSMLNYLTTLSTVHNIKAAILESPVLSIKQLAYQAARSYVPWFPKGGYIVHHLFKIWFAGSKKDDTHFLKNIKNIPAIPMLIAHVKNDLLITNDDMMKLVHAFQQKKHQHFYLFVYDHGQPNHARLKPIPEFQYVTHAFLKKYNAPHDALLAHKGTQLLAIAEQNAKESSWQQWHIMSEENNLQEKYITCI